MRIASVTWCLLAARRRDCISFHELGRACLDSRCPARRAWQSPQSLHRAADTLTDTGCARLVARSTAISLHAVGSALSADSHLRVLPRYGKKLLINDGASLRTWPSNPRARLLGILSIFRGSTW